MNNEIKKEIILLSHDKTIEYDDSEVLIDGKKIQDLGGHTSTEYAYEKAREWYKKYFSSHFENLIILTGAGSSIGIGKDKKKGKTREGLWVSIKSKVGEEKLKKLCEEIKYTYPQNGSGDIEAILSKAEKAKEYREGITDIIVEIKKQIKDECSLVLPDDAPHQLFIQKITSRKLRDPRIKLFTLNYDTLFEQAADKNGFALIDGFSYANPRSFNGIYFDYDFVIRENSRIEKEENYVPRVIHLYKLHGSLDWKKQDDGIVKAKESEIDDPLIIYPNDDKYEVTYQQPFFEMMLRFQQALRRDNVMLLVIGFSFYDKHITAILNEALKTNPSFRMVVVTKNLSSVIDFNGLKGNIPRANLLLIDETFEDFTKNLPFPGIYQSDFLKQEMEIKGREANEK